MGVARKLDNNYVTDPTIKQTQNKNRQSNRKRVPESLLILMLACICVGLCLFYLEQKVKTMHYNVKIGQMQQELDKLYEENSHLVLELESVQRLTFVEAVARAQLGMVEADSASLLAMSIPEDISLFNTEGWVAESSQEKHGLFVVVADWLNQLLPIGGVEAGRIGR